MRFSTDRWVARLFAALDAGDPARMDPLIDDDAVVRTVDGREFRGRPRVHEYVRELRDPGARTQYTVHKVSGQEGCVLVTGRRRIAERQGHSDRPAFFVMRFTDAGLLCESTAFSSREDAERMYPVLC